MKINSIPILLLICTYGIFLFACQKDISCQDCGNKAPIADAGRDTVVILPADSLVLNGSNSFDPDGVISSYNWSAIANASTLIINDQQSPRAIIKNLLTGIYQFELKVSDNKGASGKDTVIVTINASSGVNQPPVANAGADQSITLPVNTINLDGSASTDPDNNIVAYLWRKISGPASYTLMNTNAAQTQVTSLIEGLYQFELKVSDAAGLTGTDTMNVTVQAGVVISCNNRPEINVSLIPIGSLSQARFGLVSGTAGSKILFAGGWIPGTHSSRVDIYDTISGNWTAAELTIPERDGMVAGTVGSKIFFAGGGNNDWTDVTSRIDIYDAETNSWSTAELSIPRNYLATATLGNKIFFAGGGIWAPLTPGSPQYYHIGTAVVDIYDNSTNTWSIATLAEGRFELSATAVGNKIYFAGGLHNVFTGSNKIDVYDAATNSWSTSHLQEVKASHSGIAVGNKIFWAAGAKNSYQSGYELSDLVEIRDLTTNTSTFDCITPKTMFAAVKKNDNIIFFTAPNNGLGNRIEIYNITTNSWSIGILPVNIHGAAVISVNNVIYVAGGSVDGIYSQQVWRLEF